MATTTSIEWTDVTWNPTTGCDKVSPGCAHCYAEGVAERFWATQYPPVADASLRLTTLPEEGSPLRAREFSDVQCHEDRLDQPLHWKKPRKVFVNSMSDLFHEDVPDAFIDRVFAVMALARWHTYQILTKRAERMREYASDTSHHGMGMGEDICTRIARVLSGMGHEVTPASIRKRWPLSNVWLGVSVENQHFADARIPLLLQTPAAVRFISAEPLLGLVDLSTWLTGGDSNDRERTDRRDHELHHRHGRADGGVERAAVLPDSMQSCTHEGRPSDRPARGGADARIAGEVAGRQKIAALDWVIVGGESGAGARPFDIAWARSIIAQCNAAGVPVFVKQLGANPDNSDQPDGGLIKAYIHDKKGGDPAEWPSDLQVREFPEVRA